MIEKEDIAKLLEEYLKTSEDLFLVEIKNTPDNKIKVFLDSKTTLSISDCVKINHWLESKLDREIEDYELQVSSAGLGSPFKVPEQYQKAIGKKIEVALKDGRKLHGILIEKNEEDLKIEVEKKVVIEGKKKKQIIQEVEEISTDEINTTKEVITF